jgi:hypothetical protein
MSDGRIRSRRTVLATTALAASGLTAALAGCSSNVDNPPDPQVVNTSADPPLDEIGSGTVTITALIQNVGGPGDVELTVETLDVYASPVNSKSRRITMAADEQKEYTVDMEVSAVAAGIEARAEAVDNGNSSASE